MSNDETTGILRVKSTEQKLDIGEMKPMRAGLTEKSFRRYEPLIAKMLSQWPRITVIRPAEYNRSPETMSARMRDALKSLYTYRWSTTWFSSSIATIYPKLSVIMRGDMVLVGPKEDLKIRSVESFEPSNDSALSQDYVILNEPTKEVLYAYATLATWKCEGLPPAKVIARSPSSSQSLTELAESPDYDIAVSELEGEEGHYIMV